MRMASHHTYAGWFTLLRIYAGIFWLAHGVPKFLDSASYMPPSGYMAATVQKGLESRHGLYHAFLASAVAPHIQLFAELVRVGEVLVGCSLLLGIWTRLGGIAGCFLALNYIAVKGGFSSWTTIGSLDAAAFMLSFLMACVPAGRVAGVDALLWRAPAPKEPVVVPEFVDEPPPHVPPAT